MKSFIVSVLINQLRLRTTTNDNKVDCGKRKICVQFVKFYKIAKKKTTIKNSPPYADAPFPP